MKKYVIKNKDGSEQTEMPAFYNTRKKAWLTMWKTIVILRTI